MEQINTDIYISGEKFQQLADITILTEPIRQFHNSLQKRAINLCIMDGNMRDFTVADKRMLIPIKRADTIFVYTHLLGSFHNEIVPHLEKPIILITHNSDEQLDEKYLQLAENDRILHWFGQNVALNHEKVTAIPIGLANSQWTHGDLETFASISRQNRVKNRLLYMNFEVHTNPC